MNEAYEFEQIAKIIKERVTDRKEPAKMISQDEMTKFIEKRLLNIKI